MAQPGCHWPNYTLLGIFLLCRAAIPVLLSNISLQQFTDESLTMTETGTRIDKYNKIRATGRTNANMVLPAFVCQVVQLAKYIFWIEVHWIGSFGPLLYFIKHEYIGPVVIPNICHLPEPHPFSYATTTEYTELQPLLSCVHSVMRVKLARGLYTERTRSPIWMVKKKRSEGRY
jgi:hypothetical protein